MPTQGDTTVSLSQVTRSVPYQTGTSVASGASSGAFLFQCINYGWGAAAGQQGNAGQMPPNDSGSEDETPAAKAPLIGVRSSCFLGCFNIIVLLRATCSGYHWNVHPL
jgi:hypothetical protein